MSIIIFQSAIVPILLAIVVRVVADGAVPIPSVVLHFAAVVVQIRPVASPVGYCRVGRVVWRRPSCGVSM